MKESGYYWVQKSPNSDWEIAYYNDIHNVFFIDNVKWQVKHISYVYPDRIKNPYESKEN